MSQRPSCDCLCTASAGGNIPEVLFLLQNGADVNGCNAFKRTPLQVVMLGSTPVIEALLKAGADPNVHDPTCGLTVTHDAAREGFVDSVRVLVDHQADVNLTDNNGNLPLHLAAKEGHLEVVKQLIGHTKDPQMANGKGNTPGQLARLNNKMDTARFIEEYARGKRR